MFRLKDPADGHSFTVAGVDPGSNEAVGSTCCASADILRGRFLSPKGEQAVLVEEAYAKAHQLEVNHKVSIAGREFNVVGVVNSGIRPAKADMYMPFVEAERVVNSRIKGQQLQGRFNALLVEVLSSDVQDKAMKDVKALDSNLVVSTYACYRPAAQVMGLNETAIHILVVVIGLGVVLFAAKSQLASVVERRGDIGVLKAIGWSGRQVVSLLLAESVILGLIGGFLGGFTAAIGLAISEAAVPKDYLTTSADDLMMIGGILGSGVALALLGGILAGVFPALLSVRINPAEAIRKL
jgi:putative ABC transport system permease protein